MIKNRWLALGIALGAGLLVLACGAPSTTSTNVPQAPVVTTVTAAPSVAKSAVNGVVSIPSDGTWSVGVDMPAGKYRTTTATSDCYWSITKTGTNGEDIVSNHVGGGHLTVTLKTGQDFETMGCGQWVKIG